MAIKKFDRSFAPNAKALNYLNKTFAQWRQSLIDYARVYFPNSYSDFNESSPGMMFIEMASYVGDVLSYYIDAQFRENLLAYAEEQDNIIALAQAFGYKPKPTTAASTVVDFYQLCPAADSTKNYEPDTRFLLKLAPNTVVTAAQFGGMNFRTTSETNFADPTDREITVYQVNGTNQPVTYLVKKSVRATAGDIKTYTISFGTAERFSRITVPDTNVLEILSVKDSSGFTWYEVDYLAQDLIFTNKDNTTAMSTPDHSVPPLYLLKLVRTPRRFVTRYDENYNLELHFGSGVIGDSDEMVNLQPTKIANDEYQSNLASTSLDPSDFLSSNSYGLAPANVTMTISYVAGGGLSSNVPSNAINTIGTVSVLNDKSALSAAEAALFKDVVTSLAVNNAVPATGGKDADTVEEIRQNALAFFNSQNRVVNIQDYMVRTYAMPPRYGGVAKAFVAQDAQINDILRFANIQPIDGRFVDDTAGQNAVNLYVLGFNQYKKLVNLNADVKKNLRTYIDQYRMLTDEIRILDAFVVNVGVEFKIVVLKNYNMNEVLARSIDALRNFFDIDRWQINQPIILSDVYNELAMVEGVQSVTSVKINNKYRYRDGSDYNDFLYDIDGATVNSVIYPSLDPMIWEVRYPDNDILGSAAS